MRKLLCGALLLAGCYDWESLSNRFGSSEGPDLTAEVADLAMAPIPDMAQPRDMVPPTLTWTKESTGFVGTFSLNSIHGAGSTAIWAVGDNGQVIRYYAGNKSWSTQMLGTTAEAYSDVWLMPDNSSGWIVGSNGANPVAWRWTGTSWVSEPGALAGQQRAVWGNAANNVFSLPNVARNSYQFTTAWALKAHGVNEIYSGIWGTGSRFWFVGTSNSVVSFDGTNFAMGSLTGMGGTAWTAVWGFAADNVWAVGASGYTAQLKGTSWVDGGRIPMNPNMRGLWGAAPNDIWAVGDNGTLAHYDGTMWTRLTPPQITSRINAVWGYDAFNFWVCNDRGEIFRAY